jgi:hypothetical protein
MKTPEDEAFEDIERRQGGFPAKRAMAADKFIAIEERKVGERYGYVPKLHPSEWMDEPAQEPVECLDCGSNNVGIPATYDSLVNSVKSQPAQEPVAFICQGNLYMAEDVDEYCTATHIPLYTTPPKREWVGLTDEELADYLGNEYHNMTTSELRFFRLGEAAAKEKNFE